MKIKTIFLFLLNFSLLTACFLTKKSLNEPAFQKTCFSENQDIQIAVKVDHYSASKNWFYGSIEIKNTTNKVIFFNFNQRLIYDTDTLKADYNILPISYAQQAFLINPSSTLKWNVAWALKTKKFDKTQPIEVINDLSYQEKN